MILDKIFANRDTSISKTADPFFWYPNLFRQKTASSGAKVSEETAYQISAYYACVRNLAEDTSSLPIATYRKLDTGGKEKDETTDVHRLLTRTPNPLMSARKFRASMMTNAPTWGNAYAEIVRDNRGRPQQLWLIHPSRVVIELSEDGMEIQYKVSGTIDGTQTQSIIPAKDMIHLTGLSSNGIEGISVVQAGAESLGISIAEQEYTGSFLGNGAAMSGVLTHPKSLKSDALNRLRESWGSAFKGAANAGKPAILEEGMTWTQLSIPQRDAQFLEQRMFGINEICRWFRMPPHKIQHLVDATYSNIESQDRQYAYDTLMPWLVRFEDELALKLFSPQELNRGMTISHSIENRLRGDMAARAQYANTMLFNGSITINEAREMEGLNPIGPEGDVHFIQSAMTTVDMIIDPPEPPAPPAPPEPEEEEVEEVEEDDDAQTQALAITTRAACNRVVRKTLKVQERGKDDADFIKSQVIYLAQEIKPVQEAFGVTFSNIENMTADKLYDVDALTELLLQHARPAQ